MLITDHIKLFSQSPLRGRTCRNSACRFPDASKLYTPACRSWPGRPLRSWASPCGRGSTSTATARSTRPLRRCGPPASWGG